MLAVGGQHDDAEAGDVDGVAGMNDAARLALDGLEIRGIIVARDIGVFAIDAVVEELADLGTRSTRFGTPPTWSV